MRKGYLDELEAVEQAYVSAAVPYPELQVVLSAARGNTDCDAWRAGCWEEEAARRIVTKLYPGTGDSKFDRCKETHKAMRSAARCGLELQRQGKQYVREFEQEIEVDNKRRARLRLILGAWFGMVRRASPGRTAARRTIRRARATAQAFIAQQIQAGAWSMDRASEAAIGVQKAAAMLDMSLRDDEVAHS